MIGVSKKDFAELIRAAKAGDEDALMYIATDDLAYIEWLAKLIPEEEILKLEADGDTILL